jgi:hypothetical protein
MSRTPQSVLIAEEQILAAGEVLARAFFNDPLCVYTHTAGTGEGTGGDGWSSLRGGVPSRAGDRRRSGGLVGVLPALHISPHGRVGGWRGIVISLDLLESPSSGITGRSFSNLPPPNRACPFQCTRLSNFPYLPGEAFCIPHPIPSPYGTLCRPWPCARLSRAPTTTAAPSPEDSRPLGDPAFAHVRRSVRLGSQFVSFLHSLLHTHR